MSGVYSIRTPAGTGRVRLGADAPPDDRADVGFAADFGDTAATARPNSRRTDPVSEAIARIVRARDVRVGSPVEAAREPTRTG
jgi:hypothetical protein